MATTYSDKFTLLWLGSNSGPGYCAQAAYAGAGAAVTLQPVSSGNTQQWTYGSDQRIYLAGTSFCIDINGPIKNGTPLWLADMNASSKNQQWRYSGNAFYNVGNPTYLIDNNSGGTSPGNQIQIWNSSSPNTNQIWCPQLIAIPNGGPVTFSAPFTVLLLSKTVQGYYLTGPASAQGKATLTAGAAQWWVFGSDQRIYPYVKGLPETTYCLDINPMSGPITGGTTLCTNVVVPGSKTQQWSWNAQNHGITSNGSPNPSSSYFVDNNNGNLSTGNNILIWNQSSGAPNKNEVWSLKLMFT